MNLAQQPDANPYVGPRPFWRKESKLFYGREQETMDLLHLLLAERIVLLYSPSGAGKTSLIEAALVPRLLENGFEVLPTTRVGQEPPALVRQFGDRSINRYALSLLLSLEEARGEEHEPGQSLGLHELSRLATMTLTEYLDQRLAEANARRAVLIFDQFEEILTIDPMNFDEKRAFFKQVGAVLDDRPLWALFAMREDYVATLAPYIRPIPTRLNTDYRLELLRKEEAFSAIQGPAAKRGVTFVDEAAEALVGDLCEVWVHQPDGSRVEVEGPFVEPVQLQVVCRQLWEKKFPLGTALEQLPPEEKQIRKVDIAAVGHVDTALAEYYDHQVVTISDRTEVSEAAIREWFDEQLITRQETRGLVARGPGQSAGLHEGAVKLLVDAHLVRQDTRRDITIYEVSHDRLIRPIRTANRQWRQMRRSVWLNMGASAGLALLAVLLLIAAVVIANPPPDLDGYLSKGREYAEQGEYGKAIESYSEAIAVDDSYAPAYYHRGMAYLSQGKYNEAIEDLNQVSILDPEYAPAASYNLGRAHAGLEEFDEAIVDYTRAISLNHEPLNWPYAGRGMAYRHLGSPELAIADFHKAIDSDPKDAIAHYNRGLAYADLGDCGTAIEDYAQAIQLHYEPLSKPFNSRGLVYLDVWRQYEPAISEFEEAIRADAGYAPAYYNRARALAGLEDYQEAIADYTKAIELNHEPLNWPYTGRGMAQRKLGNPDLAVADLTRAINLDPGDAIAYYNRGQAYADTAANWQAMRDYEEAEDAYREAIRDYTRAIQLGYDPLTWIYNGRGNARREVGDYGAAIEDLDKAIDLEPNSAVLYNDRGLAYLDQGDYDQAIQDATRALELDPAYARAYAARGLAHLEMGEYGQAFEDLTQAIRLNYQPLSWAYNNRGRTWMARDGYGRALKDFTTAIKFDPTYAAAYYNRGLTQARQGEYKRALEDHTQAIGFDPEYAAAYAARGWAYSQLGDYPSAFRDYEHSIALDSENPWPYLNRGLNRKALGEEDLATADLERALDLAERSGDERALHQIQEALEDLQ